AGGGEGGGLHHKGQGAERAGGRHHGHETPERRQPDDPNPLGQFVGKLREYDKAGEDERSHYDKEDNRRGVDCFKEAIEELSPTHRTAAEREDRDKRRHGRRFSRRKPSEIDATHREKEQHPELPHADRSKFMVGFFLFWHHGCSAA